MPGDNVLGLDLRNSRICCCVGWIMFKRNRSASWNVIDPFIASFVKRATSWPLPQNCANSSIPSSRITVESTSKHTTFEFCIIWAAPEAFFDLSPFAVRVHWEIGGEKAEKLTTGVEAWWVWWTTPKHRLLNAILTQWLTVCHVYRNSTVSVDIMNWLDNCWSCRTLCTVCNNIWCILRWIGWNGNQSNQWRFQSVQKKNREKTNFFLQQLLFKIHFKFGRTKCWRSISKIVSLILWRVWNSIKCRCIFPTAFIKRRNVLCFQDDAIVYPMNAIL